MGALAWLNDHAEDHTSEDPPRLVVFGAGDPGRSESASFRGRHRYWRAWLWLRQSRPWERA